MAKAIVRALDNGVPIAKNTIAVLLLSLMRAPDRVQQMFSDLNRFVQKTSKSLDILYDKRDELVRSDAAMIEKVPVFKELTDKDEYRPEREVDQAVHAGRALRRQASNC